MSAENSEREDKPGCRHEGDRWDEATSVVVDKICGGERHSLLALVSSSEMTTSSPTLKELPREETEEGTPGSRWLVRGKLNRLMTFSDLLFD